MSNNFLSNPFPVIFATLFCIFCPVLRVNTTDMILIQEKNGKLVRQSEPISINGVKYQFKPLTASTVQSFQKKYLYNDIIPKTIPEVNYLKPF